MVERDLTDRRHRLASTEITSEERRRARVCLSRGQKRLGWSDAVLREYAEMLGLYEPSPTEEERA